MLEMREKLEKIFVERAKVIVGKEAGREDAWGDAVSCTDGVWERVRTDGGVADEAATPSEYSGI